MIDLGLKGLLGHLRMNRLRRKFQCLLCNRFGPFLWSVAMRKYAAVLKVLLLSKCFQRLDLAKVPHVTLQVEQGEVGTGRAESDFSFFPQLSGLQCEKIKVLQRLW